MRPKHNDSGVLLQFVTDLCPGREKTNIKHQQNKDMLHEPTRVLTFTKINKRLLNQQMDCWRAPCQEEFSKCLNKAKPSKKGPPPTITQNKYWAKTFNR